MTDIYNIGYIKLHFKLIFIEDCELHANKASAIRGGLGEMLLRANCIRDRDCDHCDFFDECVVQRIMYSRFEHKPEFMGSGDSVGYVVECENYETEFYAGDELDFNLLLFGKNIVYFNQYMQALYALGQNGLGREQARFVIEEVRNSRGRHILQQNNIYMQAYEVEHLDEYICYRKAQLLKNGQKNVIQFKTPLTQKYQGEFLTEFNMDAIIKAAQRRVYIMDAFEGHDVKAWYESDYDVPNVLSQTQHPLSVRRYSNRKEAAMYLNGILGKVELEEISEELLDLLLAGELLHIGKNTSFGFGRYVIS